VAQPPSKPDAPYLAKGGTLRITTPWQVDLGETIVFLVDGDLSLEARVKVAPGGFLAFFVSGDISLDPSVNSEDGLAAIEGVYIADGTFSSGKANTKLILEGTFVGWSGVNLERDFDSQRSNSEPVEVFRYRSDFKLNLPTFLNRPSINWQEVAP